MLTELLVALVSFVLSSAILTFYFSAFILDYMSKRVIHRDAFKITFPGTALGSIFTFLHPSLPSLMPLGPLSSSIDIGVSVAGLVWIVLTRRYCKISWLSAIIVTIVAGIVYLLVVFFVFGFLLSLARLGFLPPI